MAYTLLTARQEVAAQLGLDATVTATATLVDRWINLSYQELSNFYPWSWLESTETVVTEVDYTTGTVSVSAAGTTITFSSGPTASQANRYIQFSSADDWYKITAHTAGATTATIATAYAQTSALSAGTFTIRTVYYSLSSATEYVYSCSQAITPTPITIIPVSRYDKAVPFTDATGNVTTIYLWGLDSSGNWRFSPYPFPDSAILLEFRTIKRISDLSDTSATFAFTSKFNSTLILGALKHGYRFMDDDREDKAKGDFYALLGDFKKKDDVGLTKQYIFKAIDEARGSSNIVQFPSEFGNVRG